ncbi:MAG: pimeloyl-ACP methyl ester carboxylesterase [Planctomycetota bacterium]|jgi:pimeloyl-ACP methyl ester carboxylesterase
METNSPKEAVVLVHGLWVNGLDMSLLRHRLSTHYATHQFSYNSVAYEPAENAERLNDFLSTITSDTIHFVGHSLGGLVIRHLFHQYPQQKPGRVITLGTPHNQSHSARQLSRFLPTKILLGKSIHKGLLGELPDWSAARELGSMAGTLRFGLGLIIPGLADPNDGTVAVEETRLAGMTDHLTLRVSHFGLILSLKASNAVVKFLQTGKF